MNAILETDLIGAAQSGDIDAYAALVQEHQATVRRFLTRLVRDAAQADDLAQDVFVQGFRDLKAFEGRGSLGHWFLGIARHRAQVHWRTEARRRTRASQHAHWFGLSEAQDDPDPLEHERQMAALDTCLEAMPKAQAQLLREHYFSAVPLVQIARQSGRKEVAVRVALFRARLWLRACMQRRLGQPANTGGAQAG